MQVIKISNSMYCQCSSVAVSEIPKGKKLSLFLGPAGCKTVNFPALVGNCQ